MADLLAELVSVMPPFSLPGCHCAVMRVTLADGVVVAVNSFLVGHRMEKVFAAARIQYGFPFH
ncbi:hypothetical protein [Bradyrhizobium sp. Bra64]|uniref:hypothetical protein n=1 Tax=Bradyrhizobium sp. Bra64 TaxID=2926009 RepID=UPI0021176271|nr:hypothetical protein [Bradyrhizobium sp. Bra64]